MDYFKRYNTWIGWLVFVIAAVTYLMTMEPTASLWDCAEFIATSYKLEVGHPPGAPLFMMIARLFSIFAPSPDKVAVMVNTMSSLASAFTILFLFWSITHLARRIYATKKEQLTKSETWTIIGAGVIGALAYSFSDTFWFSAIEAEVYSLSSLFTAVVVWAMLKWEEVADEPHANRWLILIAYLMGLSIGVHILNLLTIPALVFIYYFKKYPKTTAWGVIGATLLSGAILISINSILIPYSVKAGAFVDRMLVNGLGATPNVGITIFAFAIFALAGWAIYYTHRKGRVLLNTIVLCLTVITLGYASYASVTIRAIANPPMNSNNPDNPYALLALLERDQYGSKPLIYGPYYSSPPVDIGETTKYALEDGRYVKRVTLTEHKFPSEFMTIFPRMYSYSHEDEYKAWAGVTGRKVRFRDQMINVPTAGENLRYFFGYQLNFMYWRYFMWNFVGRQSDIQSTGEITNGNWLSGIDVIDEIYLGPQSDLPSEMKDNKGRNRYFFLPFILGVMGLIYHLNRDKRNFTVVMWLFLMMGIVLVLYFNTTPNEPRERDYVYAGSFYAFAIWIGLGVMFVKEMLDKLIKKDSIAKAAVATAICSCVPIILIAQNWDDHDRSHRYVTKDIGWNYLGSTLPNSILMNYGDNDTFPVWYNQEVEGVRLDVRMMNMSYLRGDWYIDQMRIRSNESDPVPFSLPRKKYSGSTNDMLYVEDKFGGKPIDIGLVIGFVESEDPSRQIKLGDTMMDYIPAKNLLIPVNKESVLRSGIVSKEDEHLILDTMMITITKNAISKSELMLLDLLASFNWERPLYFTQTYELTSLGLRDYLQFDGFAYRLVPIKTPVRTVMEIGRVDTEYLYQKLMKEFRYGNVADPRVYTDTFIQNNFNSTSSRNGFARLAKGLMEKGDTIRAIEALDTAVERMPFSQIRHTYRLTMPIIEGYYLTNQMEKGNQILNEYADILMEYITYLMQFKGTKALLVRDQLEDNVALLDELYRVALDAEQAEQLERLTKFFTVKGL